MKPLLVNLANWAMGRCDRLAAAGYLREALPVLKKMHGAEHLRVWDCLIKLTASLVDSGKPAEAEPYAREALALARKLFGPETQESIPVLNNLGAALLFQGRPAEAEILLRECLALSEKLESSFSVEYALRNLGRLLSETGRAEEVDGLFGDFLKKTNDDKLKAFLHNQRGTIRADSGRWKEAVREFSQAVALDPEKHDHYHMLAPGLYEAGQMDRYREIRSKMLERFAETEDFNTAERMAKDSALAPLQGQDLEIACRLAEKAVSAPPNHADLAWFANARAMVEYRKGDLESALRWAEKAQPENRDNAERAAQANLILAMAKHKLGRTGEAREHVKKAAEIMEQKMKPNGFPEGNWHDWVIVRALLKEAREMIEGGLSTTGGSR